MEKEEDRRLPFLDVQLHRMEDGSLKTSVYRKPTHTNRYLHFNSHHAVSVKRGVIQCLFNRARAITDGAEDIKNEEEFLYTVLGDNGYDRHFVKQSQSHSRRPEDTSQEQPKDTIVLPYVRGLSEDIRRICKRYNIRVALRPNTTIRQSLVRVKDPIPKEQKTSVVYEVPCICGRSYIGEIIQTLKQRLYQHQHADEGGSALKDHAGIEHQILWDETKIIDQSENQQLLLLKESLHIRLRSPERKINRDEGVNISEVWTQTLRSIQRRHRV